MTSFEYTVVPAPSRGEKAKGARTGIERFAHALTVAINSMAADGWEYVRAETLPCEERAGLTGRNTVYHNVLVFRRALRDAATAPSPAAARPATLQAARAASTPAAVAPAGAATTSEVEPQAAPPTAPPDLQGERQMMPQENNHAGPSNPPTSWPDGPSPTVRPDRPHVPERVPADADSNASGDAEDALILDEDASERPQFGQPMPKVIPPKSGPADR